MRSTLIFLAVAAASVGALPLPASAEPSRQPAPGAPSSDAVLHDLLAHASAAYNDRAYKEATDYYRAAMKLRPSRDIACNFGVAARLAGSLVEAAQALKLCLAEPLPAHGRGQAEEKQRARFEADFEVVRQMVGALEIKAADGAEVFVDNTSVGRAPLQADVFVEPGARAIAATLDGATVTREVHVGAGRSATINLDPKQHKPGAQTAAPPRAEPTSKSAAERPAVIATGIAAGVAFVGGVAALSASRVVGPGAEGALAEAKRENAAGCAIPKPGPRCAEMTSTWTTAGTLHTIGVAGIVTGLVVGGGTLIYRFAVAPDRGPSFAVSPAGAAVLWTGTW